MKQTSSGTLRSRVWCCSSWFQEPAGPSQTTAVIGEEDQPQGCGSTFPASSLALPPKERCGVWGRVMVLCP